MQKQHSSSSFIAVNARAVIARINRKLAADMESVRTTRGSRARLDLGDHYVVDHRTGGAVLTHLDLEDFGRELGVLAHYERVK